MRSGGGGGGGSTSGKGKKRETVPPEASSNGDGEGSEQRYELGLLTTGGHLLELPDAALKEPVQRNKSRAASSKEVGKLLPAQPAPAPRLADQLSYDHAEGDYLPSYFEAGPSGASDIVSEGGQSLSPPQDIVNHYPTSARIATSKESSLALMADSRSVTPGTKPRMVTLLIEDRRHGTDELAEVRVPLKAAGEGYLWADAKDVCVALQSGPSRIDGA